MTTTHETPGIPSLRQVVDNYLPEGDERREPMLAALLARENEVADRLRIYGAQLGAMPEFVAFAMADVGLGNPVSEEEFQLLHQGFHARMAWLQQQFGQQGGEGAGT